VFVWIYGGGFTAGATSEANYSGELLARKGVVLVSIAYRVGPLGFMAHPELSGETRNKVSGNYGLLDMISGLRWIQKNIAVFGGDTRHVTIFGESAGGIAVSMLCASPLAKDLFHGAISESGGSFGPTRPTTFPGENLKRLADAERAGEAYAKSVGAASIAELRKLPADKLPATALSTAWPIIDGRVVPDDQYKLYEAKRYNDVPILVGYNSDEGASFTPPRTPEDYVTAEATLRSIRGETAPGLSLGIHDRCEDRPGSDARRRVWLAHLDLGPTSVENRKIQGLLLLLRSASGISRQFSARGVRSDARLGNPVCVSTSEFARSANRRPANL
jgi:para-nitrobenzyl esterase